MAELCKNCGASYGTHACDPKNIANLHLRKTILQLQADNQKLREGWHPPKMEKVTRLEVIDADGRSYTNWKVKDIEVSYQDDGRTLKIFIT